MKALCIALALAWGVQAQSFEVASIREAVIKTAADKAVRDQVEMTSTGVTVRNASLSFLIQWAWDLKFYQVSGPEWLKTQRFEVQARSAEGTSAKDLRSMMRALLMDRFTMAVHSESKELAVYALMEGKDPKIKKSSGSLPSLRVVNGSFVFENTTMTEFAERLSDFATADRPVVDRTGLVGAYDFQLESMALEMKRGEGSIITAVADLGMQLKATREPVEILIVDRCERTPSAN
ncbi:MAG: TIGR03435 family protein [Bryobacteraceae bacterium]